MKGLFSKYTWQYRRPCPNISPLVEAWVKSSKTKLPDVLLDLFLNEQYHIEDEELKPTAVWERQDVDWNAWYDAPSSMLIPAYSAPGPSSALGEQQYICRCVSATNFPALCYLLGEQFTATEIEAAWLHMPLVRPGKSVRGTNVGRKSNNLRNRFW